MGRKKREFGANLEGLGFSEEIVERVWEKGEIVLGKHPDRYRRDVTGRIVFWHSYGMDSKMGWQIDHKKPVSKGGTDNIRNLKPLQTGMNKRKGNQYPWP